jgi:hypothetical protein
LMWIEPATPAIPGTHPIPSNTIQYQPTQTYPAQKSLARFIPICILWNVFMSECRLFMAYLWPNSNSARAGEVEMSKEKRKEKVKQARRRSNLRHRADPTRYWINFHIVRVIWRLSEGYLTVIWQLSDGYLTVVNNLTRPHRP